MTSPFHIPKLLTPHVKWCPCRQARRSESGSSLQHVQRCAEWSTDQRRCSRAQKLSEMSAVLPMPQRASRGGWKSRGKDAGKDRDSQPQREVVWFAAEGFTWCIFSLAYFSSRVSQTRLHHDRSDLQSLQNNQTFCSFIISSKSRHLPA